MSCNFSCLETHCVSKFISARRKRVHNFSSGDSVYGLQSRLLGNLQELTAGSPDAYAPLRLKNFLKPEGLQTAASYKRNEERHLSDGSNSDQLVRIRNVDSVINLATFMVKSVVIIRNTHCIGLSGTLASVVSDAKMVSSMFALTHSHRRNARERNVWARFQPP